MYMSQIGAYQKTNVVTSDPKKLVVMCYDAAITNLKMAKAMYLKKKYEAKANALGKAVDIIGELREALNFEKGGEIANNLDALYGYMLSRLMQGDVKRDVGAMDEVIYMLEELGSAWKTIFFSDDTAVETVKTQDLSSNYPAQNTMVPQAV